jgi:prepilin-type N-terminal cleavage/methylation domain-containing protein
MKKLMNKKAFTIMEMLIVVAIIAVLVAIAIPTFSAQLEKAKESADVANIRATVAEIQVNYLTNETPVPTTKDEFVELVETNGNELNNESYLTVTAASTTSPAVVVYDASGHKLKQKYQWEIGEKSES